MFPIPFNFPFIQKNGKRTSIGAAIEAAGSSYSLPTASTTTKGGVKIGNNLTMDGEKLNAIAQVPSHTIAEAGKVLTVGDDGSLEWDEKGAAGGKVFTYSKNEIGGAAYNVINEHIYIPDAGKYKISCAVWGAGSTRYMSIIGGSTPTYASLDNCITYYFEADLPANAHINIVCSSTSTATPYGYILDVIEVTQ